MAKNIFARKNDASPCKHPSMLWTQKQTILGCNRSELTVPDVDFTGKWIIVTGANSGIGREATLRFAGWGANVVLGCRPNPPPREPQPAEVIAECKAAAKAAGHLDAKFELWDIDMASCESVQAFGQRWLATGRPLDILCNNAGISTGPTEQFITADGFEIVHQVNLLSHILLTLVVLPSISKATAPRILFTTSNMQYLGIFDLEGNANAGGEVAYPNNKLYSQTWLTEFQARLARTDNYKHIVVHGVHPGYVKTGIWNPQTTSTAEWVLQTLLPYVGISAQQGSICIIHTASSPDLALDQLEPNKQDGIRGALFINRMWPLEPMPHTRHEGCRQLVWDFVDKELKLQDKGLLKGLSK